MSHVDDSYVGAYNNFNISWNVVSGATNYILKVNGAQINRGSNTSFTRNLTSFGLRQYTVQASNNDGCSADSPTRNVVIYAGPNRPGNFQIINGAIIEGDSVCFSWTKPNGIVDGGYYQLYDVKPDGGEVLLCQTSQSHYSVQNHDCYATVTSAGNHDFKIKACNPNNWCSSFEHLYRKVDPTRPTQAPNTLTAPSHVSINTSFSLSWNKPTGTIDYYYVYKDGVIIPTITTTNSKQLTAEHGIHKYNVTACNLLVLAH
jgi:hypothetical protein